MKMDGNDILLKNQEQQNIMINYLETSMEMANWNLPSGTKMPGHYFFLKFQKNQKKLRSGILMQFILMVKIVRCIPGAMKDIQAGSENTNMKGFQKEM